MYVKVTYRLYRQYITQILFEKTKQSKIKKTTINYTIQYLHDTNEVNYMKQRFIIVLKVQFICGAN